MLRAVSIGLKPSKAAEAPDNERGKELSIELCGTNLRNTRELGQLVFLSDDALLSGIHHVVALTGFAAIRGQQDAQQLTREMEQALAMEGAPLSCCARC